MSYKRCVQSRLTLCEEGKGQQHAVQSKGGSASGVDDQRHDARQPEEQVHGGVLPVHQVVPAVLCIVIEMQVGSICYKLLCQHT